MTKKKSPELLEEEEKYLAEKLSEYSLIDPDSKTDPEELKKISRTYDTDYRLYVSVVLDLISHKRTMKATEEASLIFEYYIDQRARYKTVSSKISERVKQLNEDRITDLDLNSSTRLDNLSSTNQKVQRVFDRDRQQEKNYYVKNSAHGELQHSTVNSSQQPTTPAPSKNVIQPQCH